MTSETQQSETPPARQVYRLPTMLAYVTMVVAGIGYCIGVTAPMPDQGEQVPGLTTRTVDTPSHLQEKASAELVVPAAAYSDLPDTHMSPNHDWKTQLASLKQTPWDRFALTELSEYDKLASLARREESRAFNGAPPTVPHPIDQYSSRACMACHGEGLKSATLRASRMPHPFYASCTQCHVEDQARFATASKSFDTEFSGLAAPTGGLRAFPEAPPVIPHTVWMREDCLSCHGRTAAPGMATTHAWRTNCQQCHASQAELNQLPFAAGPSAFLPGPDIDTSGDSDE